MANPIEKTPIIKGEDAKRFRQSLLKSLTFPFPNEEIERKKQELREMKNVYRKFVAATNGTLLKPDRIDFCCALV